MIRVKFNIYHAVTGSHSILPAKEPVLKPLSPPLAGGDEGEGEGSPGLSDRLKRVFTYGLEWIMEEKVLLSDDEWPESLNEKLNGFVVE